MIKPKKKYTTEELWNPQIDVSYDACAYGRQSTKDQVITNIQSSISQTVGLLEEAKTLGFKEDGSTGKVTLFVENQVVDEDGNTQIKNASGTWPIDRRPGLKAILDLIESGTVKLVIVEFVDRLFRDEDRIDSNIFIKTCKENDCFVYITSKRMVYNFANPQVAEMFRQEVAFAAAYIEHHIKGTMLRRRDLAVRSGRIGGGRIPTGFVVCKAEGREYNKLVPYPPHAEIINDVAKRVLMVGAVAYAKEHPEGVFFPDFIPGTFPGARGLTKVEGGYLLKSVTGLIDMLTNPVNIGVVEYGDSIRVEHAHTAIMDLELYNALLRKLKSQKEHKNEGRRYYQGKTTTIRVGTLKRVLASSDGKVASYAWQDSGDRRCYYYFLRVRHFVSDNGGCIDADAIESLVENRLLERIKEYDLGDFTKEIKAREGKQLKRGQEIKTRLGVIDEEIERLVDTLSKTSFQSVINKINEKVAKLEQEVGVLKDELKDLQQAPKELDFSIETALSGINILEKPATIRQAILELLIKGVLLDKMSPKYFRVRIEWKIPEWGIDETYLDKGNCHSPHWKEEEIKILSEMYPKQPKMDILKALPDRNWNSLVHTASKLKILRKVRSREANEKIDKHTTWNDLQFSKNFEESLIPVGRWQTST